MSKTSCDEVPQSGWRIEKRFSPGVLIGNWSEERNKFTKGDFNHNSTHRLDFKRLPNHKPDVMIRRRAQLKNEGLGRIIFRHNGSKYSNNLISWYDEHFNGRKRESWDQLPELRHWDSHTLAWIPEKSDYPMRGASTNFGLYEKILNRARGAPVNTTTDYGTTYTSSYIPHPESAFKVSRFATHREYPNEVKSASLPKIGSPAQPASPAPVPDAPNTEQALTTVAC